MRVAAPRRERAGAAVPWTFLPLPTRVRRRAAVRHPFLSVVLTPPNGRSSASCRTARYVSTRVYRSCPGGISSPVVELSPESVRRPLAAPLVGYSLVGGAFGLTLVGVSALEKSVNRLVERPTSHELIMLAAATFKASRIVSHERVGSVVRAPFVEGDSSNEDAEPAGDGLQRAIGELVTCSRCVGTWAALGLISTRIIAPRTGRLLVTTLAVGAANDFLQASFRALCTASEREGTGVEGTSRSLRR